MEILTLIGATVVVLVSGATLAFRVVRTPGRKTARPAPQTPRMDPRKPADALHKSMTREYQRHTMALRVALDLRRARNESEALNRLLAERVLHAVAARDLGRFIRPVLGVQMLKFVDRARLDVYADRVRREVTDFRAPGLTRPLARGSVVSQLITWIKGGPRAGYAHDLVEYHRDQREHYRLAMAQARQIVLEGAEDEAQTRLVAEQAYHLRAARALGRALGLGGSTGPLGLTDPELTAVTP